MTRRRGFTLLELFIVLTIITLLVCILLPSLNSARKLARAKVAGAEAGVAVEVASEPTVEDMEEAAEDASDEHDIYDRVITLTENLPDRLLAIQIQGGLFDSPSAAVVLLWSDDDFDAVRVHVGGKRVYDQIGGEIRTYLGMGDWEYLLGEVEQKVAFDREERFRTEREMRFGPLLGQRGN